jgi:hypothetical protein
MPRNGAVTLSDLISPTGLPRRARPACLTKALARPSNPRDNGLS